MKKSLFITFTLFIGLLNAQVKSDGTFLEYMSEGNFLYLEENYALAIQNYEKAYVLDSNNSYLNYNLGICYLNTLINKGKAEKHLAKAIMQVDKNSRIDNPSETAAPPLAHFYYSQALHINYKFDEELEQLTLFERYIGPKDKEWIKKIARSKEIITYANEMINAPLNVQIKNLGDSINSIYPEYSPVLSADERTMIYTTRRPNSTGGIKDDSGNYNEDVVVSYKDDNGIWSSPVPLSSNINGVGMEAAINLTPDGQTLIIYRDGGDGMGGNIYYSNFDGTDFGPLKEFGSDVNTKYWESHACLSSDGNTLIFVSNRPGGYGGRDLYRCVRLPTGAWSKALNMGPVINTSYDEDGAFIHPDGHTFFFTSNGHRTMGGFDIMFATLDDNNQFSDVTNIGYPINTPDDDVFYVTSPDGMRGYFSSVKEGGYGEKDIYSAEIPSHNEKPLALFKGQIVPAPGEKLPEDLIIIVKDKATGEIVGTYRPKLKNGTFSTILPPGREYTFSYQAPAGNEFYSEDVFVTNDLSYTEIRREVALEPVTLLGGIKAKTSALLLNVVVFDNPKTKKPIINSKLVITDFEGTPKEYTSNANGKLNGVVLSINQIYKIYAESDNKKTETVTLSTQKANPPKTFNQILYLDGKATTASNLSLEVNVVNKKKVPVPAAKITLLDSNGDKYEGICDSKGVLANMPMEADAKYELFATLDNLVSETTVINTNNFKANQTIKKQIILDANTTVNTAASAPINKEYRFYFRYNKNKIDEEEDSWKDFINYVVEISKTKAVIVDVYSCASTVPTRAYKNNKMLAASRAKKTVETVTAALTDKGANLENITFKRLAKVGGPQYAADYMDRKKYEPYQFVRLKTY